MTQGSRSFRPTQLPTALESLPIGEEKKKNQGVSQRAADPTSECGLRPVGQNGKQGVLARLAVSGMRNLVATVLEAPLGRNA